MKNIADKLKTTGKKATQKSENNSSEPLQQSTHLPANERKEQPRENEGQEAPRRHSGRSGRRSRDNFGSYRGY